MAKKPVDPTDAQLSAEDREDLAFLQAADAPIDHTLLEIWRNVLGNLEASLVEKVAPTIALKIVSSWPKMDFQDVQPYHERYHEILLIARDSLDAVIRSHPNCLKNVDDVGSASSDAVANRSAYVELLFEWQFMFMRLEHDWDSTAATAAIEVAAIADAAAFLVSDRGLIQHLGQVQVGFQFSPDDQDALQARLQAARAEL